MPASALKTEQEDAKGLANSLVFGGDLNRSGSSGSVDGVCYPSQLKYHLSTRERAEKRTSVRGSSHGVEVFEIRTIFFARDQNDAPNSNRK